MNNKPIIPIVLVVGAIISALMANVKGTPFWQACTVLTTALAISATARYYNDKFGGRDEDQHHE